MRSRQLRVMISHQPKSRLARALESERPLPYHSGMRLIAILATGLIRTYQLGFTTPTPLARYGASGVPGGYPCKAQRVASTAGSSASRLTAWNGALSLLKQVPAQALTVVIPLRRR